MRRKNNTFQATKCGLSVLNFFEGKTVSEELCISILSAQRRTVTATGISMGTIAQIKKEVNISLILLMSGKQKRPQKNQSTHSSVDDFDLCVICKNDKKKCISTKTNLCFITNVYKVFTCKH